MGKIKSMSAEELREKISKMRPEDRDQLLSDLIEQLKLAKVHPSLEGNAAAHAQIDVTIEGLTTVLETKGLWDL